MLKVTYTKTEQIIPYARNARTHSDEQIAQVAASIREFGFTNPILIDPDKTVIAGHGRLLAAQRLGLDKVPTIVLADLTESQRRAYVIADNKLALNAGWDDDLLSMELLGVTESDIDVLLTGFLPEEISALAAQADAIDDGNTDPDDVPDVHVDAKSKTGDVWLLGRHRLMCGDSGDENDVLSLTNSQMCDVCLTDPPYGLGDTQSEKNNYDTFVDSVENLETLIEKFLPIAFANARITVLTPGNKNQRRYIAPTWTMAWFVPAGVGRGPWGFCCWQPILCYGKDPKLAKGKGSHPDAIVHTESSEQIEHPCAKPIRFWSWLMCRVSEVNEKIFEPFSGSGTGIIAAEMNARTCCAMEISPQYTDLAVRRWQDFTGKQATLESTGAPFGD